MTVAEPAGPDANMSRDAEQFFDAASQAFVRAVSRAGVREHDLAIAGEVVRLRFAGDALEPMLLPALEHLRVTGGVQSDPGLTVAFFDSESTGELMPAPAWGPLDWGTKGEIAGFNDDRFRTLFQPGVDILNLYDAVRRAALYWVAARRVVPWWESSFPLRTILHWWCAPTPLQPVHAGGVGRDRRGVLVAGNSGAGKSTTTLACLEADMDYVGDDYVLVDVEALRVHSLYGTAKLEPDNLKRFPALAPLIVNAERLDVEKAMAFLHDYRPERLVAGLHVQAIVMPTVTGLRRSHLEAASPAEALRVLAPTTSYHLPGYRREVFTKLTALVRALPCYRLHAGTDLEQVAATVAGLVES